MAKRFKLSMAITCRLFAIAPTLLLDAGNHFLDRNQFQSSPKALIVAPTDPQSHKVRFSNRMLTYSCRIMESIKSQFASFYNLWVSFFLRSAYLVVTFTPPFALFPLLFFDSMKILWWDILRDAIIKGGPCMTKLAQWIATRPDLFPLDVCIQLQQLQSMKTHGLSYNRSQVDRLLWQQLRDEGRYKDILLDGTEEDLVTLGSGCIAQVVKGQLLQSNGSQKPIAIKLVHPHLRNSIETDMRILAALVDVMEKLLPGVHAFSLSQSVQEFSTLLHDQLDMNLEAQNLMKFRSNFSIDVQDKNKSQKSPARPYSRYISFPCAYPRYCTEHILVEEYVEGKLISEVIADPNTSEAARRGLGDRGLTAILKMVFEDNFFHADLHPGNIICQRISTADEEASKDMMERMFSKVRALIESTFSIQPVSQISEEKYRIVLIDTGLAASLDREDRRNFIDLFHAVVTNDGARAGALMIERSASPSCLHPEEFNATMKKLIDEVHKDGLMLKNVSVGKLLQQVLVACYTHQVKLDPKFVSLVLALGIMEGLGQRLDPDVNILLKATPWVLQAVLVEYKEKRMGSKSS